MPREIEIEVIGDETRIAIDNFSQKPLSVSSLSDVPGIGEKTQQELQKNGIFSALALYNELKKVKFIKTRFRDFFKKRNIPNARVPVFYKAFKQWHDQFDDTSIHNVPAKRSVKGLVSSRRGRNYKSLNVARSSQSTLQQLTPSPEQRLVERKSSSSPEQRPNLRVPTPSPEQRWKRRKLDSEPAQAPVQDNTLIPFLVNFLNSFEKIPTELHDEFKQDVLNLASKYERMKSQ